jgi:transcriptional regulator with XRE-family HTH domain
MFCRYICAVMTLKEARKSAKVTIKDTGLSARTVSKIESGNCNVRICSLRKYLSVIGMELKYCLR